MSVQNEMKVSGKLKNIRTFSNTYGTLVVAQLTQKNGVERAKFTMPIAVQAPELISTLQGLAELADSTTGYTPDVIISGQLDTKFDTRRDVPNDERRQPLTRIMVESIELAQ